MEELLLSNPLPPNIALSIALLLFPLVAFFYLIFSKKKTTKTGAIVASTLIGASFLLSLWLFSQIWTKDAQHYQVEWFHLWHGTRIVSLTVGILLDDITVLLLVVVTFVSFLVHIFSFEYMKGDHGFVRYFAFLGLFTFAMLGIILADNLLLLFIFWELVGLASYLLIGFWFQKESAVRASKKAFLVNRLGDLGFLIAIMILWSRFGTLDLQGLKLLATNLPQEQLLWLTEHTLNLLGQEYAFSVNWFTVAGIGLFCGVMAKSAQFPLQFWLPDAMEGPTPVSALIHAATMVAAGIFLLARVFGLLNMEVLTFIAFVGAITAFTGAFAAFAQNDIKKVLAYSTISQLGYMVMGIGTGGYGAALFHLFTHAFFKACLFLCAGSVIHALHRFEHDGGNHPAAGFDAQDMRFMGGLRKQLPTTFFAYAIAAASLIGLPFFSGFLSKDALLASAWAWAEVRSGGSISLNYLVPDLAFLTVLMTAAYMTRQFILVFLGNFRGAIKQTTVKIKEKSWAIKAPLVILALLSLGIVFATNPFSSSWVLEGLKHHQALSVQFLDSQVFALQQMIFRKTEALHLIIAILSIVMALAGIIMALSLYRFQKEMLPLSPTLFGPKNILYRLSSRNWYLDEISNHTFAAGTIKLSLLLRSFDRKVIDGLVNFTGKLYVVFGHVIAWIDRALVDGLVHLAVFATGRIGLGTKDIQSGGIQSYFKWALMGLIIIFALLLL